jgi:enoyl-[acyl-carrier protein] reductase II
MKTKITELFGIRYPVVLSGMSWISVPGMVAAVSNAGGLGILATGPLHPDETRAAIREIRKLTDKPFGANATLLFPGAARNAKVLLEEKVPVINFSLGKGDWLVKAAHEYGGKVVATVVNHRHAKRAEEYGTDALPRAP